MMSSPISAAGAEPAARSGVYDNLIVVVAGDVVRGAFFDQRGQFEPGGSAPFSCIFLLRGTLHGEVASVTTWAPGDAQRIRGELRFRDGGASLRLAEEPGGCGMTTGDMVRQPYEMARGTDGAGWLDVGMIAAKRSPFYREPGLLAPRAPFVVAFDPVVILERRPGWVRARYLGGQRSVTGWLRSGDLALPDPPNAN